MVTTLSQDISLVKLGEMDSNHRLTDSESVVLPLNYPRMSPDLGSRTLTYTAFETVASAIGLHQVGRRSRTRTYEP